MSATTTSSTEFLPRSFSQGGYTVRIEADRSIVVFPDDWLSKYSMAIYGDFNHINEFMRINEDGDFEEILEKDCIDVGEILYHPNPLPGEPKSTKPGVTLPDTGQAHPKRPLKSTNVSDFLQWCKQRFVETDWRVSGTGGGDLSISFGTAQYATIGIVKQSVSVERWYHAVALGVTAGFPTEGFIAGGSFSTTQFPSLGTIVRFAWRRELTIEDFRHGIIVLEFAGNLATPVVAGPGGSVAFVLFGIQFPLILMAGILRYFRDGNVYALGNAFNKTAPAGCAILGGGTVGMPGGSASVRVGAMYDRRYFGL